MKTLILAFALSAAAFAQGSAVTLTEEPPQLGYQYVLNYSGTNLISICYARSVQTIGPRSTTSVSISGISKANPGVITSVGHGFAISSRPSVTISGATGTGWVSGANTVNGTFVATVIDADTFSIPVNTTGNGTLAGTVIFRTTAPRSTMYEWAVKKLTYDGSSNLIWTGWVSGSSSLAARCSDASSTTVAQQ